jgi:hypothetical protein
MTNKRSVYTASPIKKEKKENTKEGYWIVESACG